MHSHLENHFRRRRFGSQGPTNVNVNVNDNGPQGRPDWTKTLRDKARTHVGARPMVLHKFIEEGVMPADDKGRSRLVRQLVRYGESLLLPELFQHCAMGTLTLSEQKTGPHDFAPPNFSAHEWKTLLTAMQSQKPHIATLELSGLELDAAARAVVHDIVTCIPALKCVKLQNDCVLKFERNQDDSLYRMHVSARKAPGQEAVLLLAGILQDLRPPQLAIDGKGLTRADHLEIANALRFYGGPIELTLRNVSSVPTAYLQFLGANATLSRLTLIQSPLGEAGCNKLIEALKDNSSLMEIRWQVCKIMASEQSKTVLKLAELVNLRGLRELRISDCALNSESIISLLEALKSDTKLERLNLSQKERAVFRVDGSYETHVVELIEQNKTLTHLDLPGGLRGPATLGSMQGRHGRPNTTLRRFHVDNSMHQRLFQGMEEHVRHNRKKWQQENLVPYVAGGLRSLFSQTTGMPFPIEAARVMAEIAVERDPDSAVSAATANRDTVRAAEEERAKEQPR